MQQRHLALLFAEMGYPEASRAEAAPHPRPSRCACSARSSAGSTPARSHGDHGRLDGAAALLPEVEDLLRRGIACGAFADPWNMLGFQGLFPLSAAREDAIRDPRLEELVQAVEQTFSLYARLMSEAAAAGDAGPGRAGSATSMERLAAWWDPFAAAEVSDVRRVHGGEAVASARNVAAALAAWRRARRGGGPTWPSGATSSTTSARPGLRPGRRGAAAQGTTTARRWACWRAGSARPSVTPLEDGNHSFHNLALRWMLALTRGERAPSGSTRRERADLVDAVLRPPGGQRRGPLAGAALSSCCPCRGGWTRTRTDEDDDPFGAAYEDVTYQDSTDNDEGAVSDGGAEGRLRPGGPGRAAGEAPALPVDAGPAVADRRALPAPGRPAPVAARAGRRRPGDNRQGLLALLDALHAHPLPEPAGDSDSLVEYDRRRVLKEQLIYATIGTCLDTSLAVGALGRSAAAPRATAPRRWQAEAAARWSARCSPATPTRRAQALRPLPAALPRRAAAAHAAERGAGRRRAAPILRVRIAQAVLRSLLANLPRLGLLRETYDLLRTARGMEQAHPTRGRGVTEFNHFFQSAYQSVVENVVALRGRLARRRAERRATRRHAGAADGPVPGPVDRAQPDAATVGPGDASPTTPSGRRCRRSCSATAATCSTPAS